MGAIAFVLSRRGKPQLHYQGYLFNSDSMKNGRVYWRCSEKRRGTCMARLLTTSDNLIEKQPYHDHPPNTYRTDGKKLITFKECFQYFCWSQKETTKQEMAQEFSVEYVLPESSEE